jgi:hypothetical protein
VGRLENTWRLAKSSWAVLKQDKELMALPLLSLLATLLVAAAFIYPLVLVDADLSGNGTSDIDPGAMGYVFLFFGYLIITFIGQFFIGALVAGAHERMTGGDPTVSSALRGAGRRFHRLLPWALVTGTVGLVLSAIEDRGIIGSIVANLLSFAWRVITFLVVPVLVIEDIGALDAVKRSSSLFKKTWGENLAAQFGFGLIGFVAMLPVILVTGALVATGNGVLLVTGIAIGVVGVLAVMAAMGALTAIFQTALYMYAAQDTQPPEFDAGDLSGAYRLKG